MESFFKALGVLNYCPEVFDTNFYFAWYLWREYTETISKMISCIEESIEEYPEDLIESYKEFIGQGTLTPLEDPQEVWDDIENILEVGDLQGAFGSEGWRHVIGWSD